MEKREIEEKMKYKELTGLCNHLMVELAKEVKNALVALNLVSWEKMIVSFP